MSRWLEGASFRRGFDGGLEENEAGAEEKDRRAAHNGVDAFIFFCFAGLDDGDLEIGRLLEGVEGHLIVGVLAHFFVIREIDGDPDSEESRESGDEDADDLHGAIVLRIGR